MNLSILLSLCLTLNVIKSENLCGNWDSYKDEKCFAVLEGSGQLAFEAARALCAKQAATLITITTAEEQAFLTDLIFNKHNIVDEIWIGAHKVDKKVLWESDDTEITYTNWAAGAPANVTGENCVQMLPKKTNEEGKWDDEDCMKKNLVVCQKFQIWTPAVIQKTLLKERKQLEELQNEIRNTIPIGFTFTQLPNQKAPADIWPQFKWTDISASYAGVFFRVLGGTAAAFNAVQDEDVPRLHRIAMSTAAGYKDAGDPIPKGGMGKIKTGVTGGPWYFQFEVTNAEVRPRNMAVRVWQRSG